MLTYVTGSNCTIDDDATLGYVHDEDASPTVIGDDATIRSGTIVYCDVDVGDNFQTGHRALVREATTIGDGVVVGTDTVIDGRTVVGDDVSFQTGVYVPPSTTIGDEVFLGPRAVLTDDPYPVRQEGDGHRQGPTIADGATVGANATVLPDVTIGEDAFVSAGAVVTEDVPADTLAVGVPARHEPIPDHLAGGNQLA